MCKVEIYEDEPRAGTYLISQGFEREHKVILELIRKYENDFEYFGSLKRRKLKSTGGRAANEILLNEDQTMFLGTLLRNNKQSVEFKKNLIMAFKECRMKLESVQGFRSQPGYHTVRGTGKIVRNQTTDVIKRFVEYAEGQGSRNAGMYYTNITRMVNGLLFIVDGKFKNLREVMSVQQLMTISSAEQIIDRGLRDGMSRKKFYKDVYQDVRSKVKLFADMHGKSEVVQKYLNNNSEGENDGKA